MDWVIIHDQQWLSAAIWLLLTISLLYFARRPVHQLVIKISMLTSMFFRFQAKVLSRLASSIRLRNREVLLEAGKWQLERAINRHFHRVHNLIATDLGDFPVVQKKVASLVTQLEADYHQTAETEPRAPEWVEAIEAIAHLKEAQNGHPVIAKILADYHAGLEAEQLKTRDIYRENIATRHKILHSMMPHWRTLNNSIERIGRLTKNVIAQAEEIDKTMDFYREVQAGTYKAERRLQRSAWRDIVVNSFFLTIFVAIAWLTVQFISTPMMVLMTDGAALGPMVNAETAGWLFVQIVLGAGLVLMETLHITAMFPALQAMGDANRRILFWAMLCLIFLLACMAGSLAFVTEDLPTESVVMRRWFIEGGDSFLPTEPSFDQWLPQIVQMVIGFTLPFVLVFTPVPFEGAVYSGRTVTGNMLVYLLRLMVFLLNLSAALTRHIASIAITLYDIVIFFPLWLEEQRLLNKEFKAEGRTSMEKNAS